MIELQQVEFAYPRGPFRLKIDGLTVASGEQIAVIGPSGSGKSTLLQLIAGILVPAAGRVVVGDVDLTTITQAARRSFRITRMGLVFQEFELIEYLNVLDNILLPFRIHHALKLTTDIRRRASGLARSLGIDDKLHRWPGQLSQGERQRVAIGRALITNPQWLLADEPTGNLDPAGKRRVLDLMLDQAAQRALTVVLVTHDHGLLDRFDRVVDVGRIGAVRGAESAAVVGDSIQSGAAES